MINMSNLKLGQRMHLISGVGIIGNIALSSYAIILHGLSIPLLIAATFFISLQIAMAEYVGRHASKRCGTLVDSIKNINNGDLTKPLSIPGKGEFSWMASEFDSSRKSIAALVNEISGGIQQLSEASRNLSDVSNVTSQDVQQQQAETSQVASAVNEMAATVQEVASNAASAAQAARDADKEAMAGKSVVSGAINSIDSLAHEVEQAADTLQKLDSDIGNIGDIVSVIRGITEQTNLLALNAAIEAARAGEHGRGFAVVADEVRTLASRTQDSTHEIEEMVGRLQAGAKEAVSVMENSRNQAQLTVEGASGANDALDKITEMITTIDQMNAQIAEASKQQSSVADGINQSIVNISAIVERTAGGVQQTANSTQSLSSLSEQLMGAASRFKV